ncbi:MAG: peptidase S24 [Candidatus Wallbacteria bacterium HGW-Wallbacteria-1]|uniref:Peptidase S24 n=1 Tax=Candidatus Wallbacteria bacterium HGW-Wallbacteria-1 TaxID=2013854 RepID=A0A2N1PMV4_9BACT|nr:MAG: peptidase S24 [Candidatus Wallbacteria bacterium HGW-Wallbacteria-1]
MPKAETREKELTRLFTPMALSPIAAGFPSPAEDFMEKSLDLNEHIIRNPPSTFLVRVSGDSMVNNCNGGGIQSGDILVVDKSLHACSGRVVIAILNGEFTVKRLRLKNGQAHLIPDNPDFPVIPVTGDDSLEIWGTVTWVLRQL